MSSSAPKISSTASSEASTFDTDPFGAFAWRGRSRDELLMRLRQLSGAAAADATSVPSEVSDAGLGDVGHLPARQR